MPYSPYRIVLAVATAAVVACFFTIITATADPIEISAPIGAQCSQQAWPHYESHCLRDRRQQSAARPLRIVTTERW